jgi:hypothetical protein
MVRNEAWPLKKSPPMAVNPILTATGTPKNIRKIMMPINKTITILLLQLKDAAARRLYKSKGF